ncbi:MAG: hypothetical protein JJ896_12045 [Rhodothermales bacterium]|nr:hypothetical protein [Rhodothermales bacterium]MBO6780375.1 hypothetical protein [Rhodothermales bacterium]
MRSALFVAAILLLVFSASPASAQLKTEATQIDAPVRLYDAGGTGISLNRYFSPQHFRMGHSFELSSGYGGSMGMYTNSMMWQFSSKLAARVDVAMAYMPDGGSSTGMLSNQSLGGQNGRLFLRNAEIAYRPRENMEFHFQVRQSPYGRYMSPYGYDRYGSGFQGRFGYNDYAQGRLFWNSDSN